MKPEVIHENFDDWAAAAVADGLSPEEQSLFTTHVAACPQCAALYQKTQAMNQTLTDIFALERPAPNFENKLVTAFRERGKRSWFAKIPTTIAWLLSLRGVQTASALAALTLLVAVGNQLTRPSGGGSSLAMLSGKVSDIEAESDFDNNGKNPVTAGNRSGSTAISANAIDALLFEGRDALDVDKTRLLGDVPVMGRLFGADKSDQPLSINAPVTLAGENFFDSRADKDYALSKEKRGVDLFAQNEVTTKSGRDGTIPIQKQMEAKPGASEIVNGSFKDQNVPSQSRVAEADVAEARSQSTWEVDSKWERPVAKYGLGQTQPPLDPTPGLVDARKLIRNANVELEVASFDTALDKLGTAATQAGGYVATKNSAKGGNGKLRGTIVIKVLPQNLDGFLLELRSVGEVKNQTLGTQDVTKEYTDTASRLRNAQRMEERLLKMLDEAKGKMSEILAVEKELGRVRESIETMQGELKMYDSLVAYATVTISLYEKDLNQPAAFLLRQTGNLELLAADVEKTYAEARRIAESVQAQIGDANISRDANGRMSATMQLIIPAPDSERTVRQLKELGRIANFTSETQRIAQNGSDAAGSSNAKVENAPAVFRVTIQHDEQTHRQIRFTVFAKDLDPAFDAAKKAAADAGAEVVSSNLVRPRNNAGNASLVLRVPSQKHAELVATLQKLGRASDYQVQRDATNDEAAPVLVSLNLTDEEPSVQQTRLSLQGTDIEKRVQDFKKDALAAGATVRDSAYERQLDGRETARIVLRFPLTKYADLLARAQTLGKTQELTVQRRDIAAGETTDNAAPAELSLTLTTQNKIVADNNGLFATLRRTMSQAISSLLWSVQMIGVALAFLAPWAAGLGVAWFVVRRFRRKE